MEDSCYMCTRVVRNEGNLKSVIKDAKKKRKTLDPNFYDKPFAIVKKHIDDNPVMISLRQTETSFREKNPKWKKERISVPIKNMETAKFPANKTVKDANNFLNEKYEKLCEEKEGDLELMKMVIQEVLMKEYTEEELPKNIGEKMAEHLVRKGVKNESKVKNTMSQQVQRSVQEIIKSQMNRDLWSQEIYNIVEKISKRGIEDEILSSNKLTSNLYGKMIMRKGEEAELLVKRKLEECIGDNAALVIQGFKVWTYTNKSLERIGVKLETASKKNEVEHDLMVVVAEGDQLKVKFLQVKNADVKPWETLEDVENQESAEEEKKKRDKFINLATKALDQTIKDVRSFLEVFPDFTADDIDNIQFECFAALPNSSGEGLCQKCSEKILTEEMFVDIEKLRGCLHLDGGDIPDGVGELYTKIASRYLGLGSLMPLKTLGDYYKEELKQLDNIEAAFKRSLEQAKEDQSEVEFALRLSDDQLRAACSRHNLILTGPHGTGKTILLLLGVSKRVNEIKSRGRKAKVFLIIWESSWELLTRFQDYAKQYEDDAQVEVLVYFPGDLRDKFGIKLHSDKVKTINEVMAKMELEETEETETIVAIDELSKVTNSFPPESFKDVIIFIKSWLSIASRSDFSGLTPGSIQLLVSIQPVAADHENNLLGLAPPPVLPVIGPESMDVVTLRQVFRSTTAIHQLLKTLHKDRVPAVGEAWMRVMRTGGFGAEQVYPSCVMEPEKEGHGHTIQGTLPEWFVLSRCSHFVCSDAVGCFLKPNLEKLSRVVRELRENFGQDKVTVIVDVGEENDGEAVQWIKKKMDIQRVYRIEEFVGGETEALVFIHRGGEDLRRDPLKYNGWSRAMSQLTIFTDDTRTNTWYDLKAANNSGHIHMHDLREEGSVSMRRTLSRVVGREDWILFIYSILFFIPPLLLHLVPLVVASVLHWRGATSHIKRIRDYVAGGVGLFAISLWLLLSAVLGVLFNLPLVVRYTVSWGLYSCATTLAMLSDWSIRAWAAIIWIITIPVIIVFVIAIIIPIAIFIFLARRIFNFFKWAYSKVRRNSGYVVL